mmetsp:Transcript_23907/g.60014  ORF Transcript_23907/g.60014 Transcript_23907/m.60014 type:complete len:155 (+) Transcript_23907:1017-1481(+)
MHKRSNASDPTELIMTEVSPLSGIKPERGHLGLVVSTMGFVSQVKRETWFHWADVVQHHKFVICPWGHGLDTHRTWEVLLLGSFPVVRSSSLDSLYNGLPVLIVQQWKEIAVQMLASARHQFLSSSDIHQEKLFFEYWQNLILAFQQIQMDIHA